MIAIESWVLSWRKARHELVCADYSQKKYEVNATRNKFSKRTWRKARKVVRNLTCLSYQKMILLFGNNEPRVVGPWKFLWGVIFSSTG